MSAVIALSGVRHSLTYFGMVASTACREKQWHSTVDLTRALQTPIDDAPECLLCRSGQIAKRPSNRRIAGPTADFKTWKPREDEQAPSLLVMAPKNFGKERTEERKRNAKQRNALRVPYRFRIDIYDADEENGLAFGSEDDRNAFARELDERERFSRVREAITIQKVCELSKELNEFADALIGPRRPTSSVSAIENKHKNCNCLRHKSARVCATSECTVLLRPKQGEFCKTCLARTRKQRQRQREAAVPTGILITITFLPRTLEQVAS